MFLNCCSIDPAKIQSPFFIMSTNEIKNLKVFGYGLALLIAYLTMLKVGGGKPSFFIFVLSLAALLWVLAHRERPLFKAAYYLLLFGFQLSIARLLFQNPSGIAAAWFGLSLFLFLLSQFKVQLLEPVYRVWMKLAHAVGGLLTAVTLTVFFYLIFGLVGIVLRLLRKDLLDRTWDESAKSYWVKKNAPPFEKINYLRQF